MSYLQIFDLLIVWFRWLRIRNNRYYYTKYECIKGLLDTYAIMHEFLFQFTLKTFAYFHHYLTQHWSTKLIFPNPEQSSINVSGVWDLYNELGVVMRGSEMQMRDITDTSGINHKWPSQCRISGQSIRVHALDVNFVLLVEKSLLKWIINWTPVHAWWLPLAIVIMDYYERLLLQLQIIIV